MTEPEKKTPPEIPAERMMAFLAAKKVHDDFKTDRASARSEFLWLVSGAIAAVVVLVGVMAHGFHWI